MSLKFIVHSKKGAVRGRLGSASHLPQRQRVVDVVVAVEIEHKGRVGQQGARAHLVRTRQVSCISCCAVGKSSTTFPSSEKRLDRTAS
jgi:hypothetical protein